MATINGGNDTLVAEVKGSTLQVWNRLDSKGEILWTVFNTKIGEYMLQDGKANFFANTGSGWVAIKPEGSTESGNYERLVKEIVEYPDGEVIRRNMSHAIVFDSKAFRMEILRPNQVKWAKMESGRGTLAY